MSAVDIELQKTPGRACARPCAGARDSGAGARAGAGS